MEIRKIDKIQYSETARTAGKPSSADEVMFGSHFDPDEGIKIEKNAEKSSNTASATKVEKDEDGNTVVYSYDNGKLVSKKLYTNNADKPSLTEEFSNGKRIRTTYVDGKIEARNVFGPNNEPLELMKKTVFHTGEKVYVNYRFKEDGTRLCEDFYRIDDTQKPFLTIRYSENGKKITQATKREDDGRYSVTEYTSWEYPAEKTYYNDENLTSISEKITYNKKGGEIEHIYYDSEGNIVPYKNIFADTQK